MSDVRVLFVQEIPVTYRSGWLASLQTNEALSVSAVYLAGKQTDRPWEKGELGAYETALRSRRLGSTGTGFFPRVTPGLADALDVHDPEFLVVPGWAHPASWTAARWALKRKRPYGVMFESWQPQRQTRVPPGVSRRIRNAVLERAAVAMPVGKRAADFATGLGVEQLQIVHGNTCDSQAIASSTEKTERSNRPTALFVGRLLEHKGAGKLTDLARLLAKAGIRLQVVGDGPLLPVVASSHAEILGSMDASLVHHQMAQAHVVVVPSLAEPWGVVVHEALSAGTPVVASNAVGSSTDLLDGFEGGRIVEPEVAQLSEAVQSLLPFAERPESREACQHQGLTISYETATAELEAAVASVMKGRN